MGKKYSTQLVAAITADLQNPDLPYMLVAIKHHVSLSYVGKVAKSIGLARKKGPKAKA